MTLESLIRPNILKMKPYSSARDEFSGTAHVFLDANENPFETGVNRYPDPYQQEIKKNLSAIKGVDRRSIFLGNGSDEPIDLLIRIFCEPGHDKILTTDPTYGMYGVAAAINNIEVIRVALSEDFELNSSEILAKADSSVKIIFLCSPNNPSGNLLAHGEIEKILNQFSGIVVIDEAYIDFSNDPGFLPFLSKYPHLVILQTFSKAWGMAGLRVGMAFASPEIIQFMNKVKPPYNINVLSQQHVLNALRHRDKVIVEVRELISEREKMKEDLSKLSVVRKIYKSDSNFLLVQFKGARQIFDYLLNTGIIIRDRTSVMHGEDCLRITIGTKDENKKLISALQKFSYE